MFHFVRFSQRLFLSGLDVFVLENPSFSFPIEHLLHATCFTFYLRLLVSHEHVASSFWRKITALRMQMPCDISGDIFEDIDPSKGEERDELMRL